MTNKYFYKAHAGYPRLLHPDYDSIFKAIVSAGWCVKSDGDVESVPGFYSLTEIPSHQGEFSEMMDAAGISDQLEIWETNGRLKAGWYITVEDSYGTIMVYEYLDKSRAEEAFEILGRQYVLWCNADDIAEGEGL